MAFNVGLSLQQPDEYHVPMEPLWVHCANCGHEWAVCGTPAPANDVSRALKAFGVCKMCRIQPRQVYMNRRPRTVRPGDSLGWLLYSFDTGTSSETMYHAITGTLSQRPRWRPGVPGDVQDFGRCYRLMKTMEVPMRDGSVGWRQFLPKVADAYPMWKPFVEAWDELCGLYESEMGQPQAPKTYARLKALGVLAERLV